MPGEWTLVWNELTDGLRAAIAACGYAVDSPRIELAIPREAAHGDWTTNLALTLAKPLRLPPRKIAEALAAAFPPDAARFLPPEVAGPGFLNFRYAPEFLERLPAAILASGEAFGTSDFGAGEKVLVEYVSANPTGPLNVVNARAAAVGSALVRLLRATGHHSEGEFYVNDAGVQTDLLGASLAARFAERIGVPRALPENGYLGAYLHDLALQLPEAEARRALETDDVVWFRDQAVVRIVAWQQKDLADYGAEFATWFRESSLHASGAVMEALAALEARGVTYRAAKPAVDRSGAPAEPREEEAPGGMATFLRTSDYGDDKDRVVRKSDGRPAYILPDIAYHRNKRERFRYAIDLWGPDHHGYVPRMKAAMLALGLEPDFLEILIVQQVNLLSGGEQVKMSKRAGEFITLRELMDDVGADCGKFFFLLRSTGAHLDFDLDLAKRQNDENPAFYVQYAHARIAALLRFAAEKGLEPEPGPRVPLGAPEEVTLVRKLATFPEVVRGAAFAREPHRLPAFLMELAAEFHRFYHACRVVGDDPAVSRARLQIAAAARVVLRNGLALMGVSAPERMERSAEVPA
jgi:arginyl-tRNA synthetase